MTVGRDRISKEISASAKFWWQVARFVALMIAVSTLLETLREEGLFGRPFGSFLREWLDAFAMVTDQVFVPLADFLVWVASLMGLSITLGSAFKVFSLVFMVVFSACWRNGMNRIYLAHYTAMGFATAVLAGLMVREEESSITQFFYFVMLLLFFGFNFITPGSIRGVQSSARRIIGIDLIMVVVLSFAVIGLDYFGGVDLVFDLL